MTQLVQTRAQRQLVTAHNCVKEVLRENADVQKIYGTIARDFGVVVRTTGLAQAMAFAESKAGTDNARQHAYRLLLKHLAQVLELPAGQVIDHIRTTDTTTYLQYTQEVLQAMVYFRRFVVSLLRIDDTPPAEDPA